MSPSAVDPQAFRVAIVGAGIAGVCLATALARRNPRLQVTVYEKRPGITELGVGVGIGPNATRALGLVDPELRREYDKIVTLNGERDRPSLDFDIYAGDGPLRGRYLGEMLARDDVPHGGVNRLDLMNVLYSTVPGSVDFVFNKRVTGVQTRRHVDEDEDEDEDEIDAVAISFEDGTAALADAVVGCDGIRSPCRELIVGKGSKVAAPVFSGRYCYRSVLPMSDAVGAAGPVAQTRRLITGHGRHILMFPVQKGEGLNIAAFVQTNGEKWDSEHWLVPASREDILKDFEGFDEGSMGLLKLVQNTSKWGLFDSLDAPSFVDASGTFCIMGDAAHASSPHCGAGAGMAIEDAYVLSMLMRPELLRSARSIRSAFRAFDAVRRPRTQELVRRSRRQGGLFCLQLTDEYGLLPDFNENMEWVWDVDFDEMVNRADRIFASFEEESWD